MVKSSLSTKAAQESIAPASVPQRLHTTILIREIYQEVVGVGIGEVALHQKERSSILAMNTRLGASRFSCVMGIDVYGAESEAEF